MNKELIDESLDLNSNDGSYQRAKYCPPNYKDLSSASKALDEAIRKFFDACMEKYNGK